jgi:adenosylhomocysteinase
LQRLVQTLAGRNGAVGVRKIEWARDRMGILREVGKALKKGGQLAGLRIGMALHVEAKTAVLALTLQEAGARVTLAGCNPLSTDDEVAQALVQEFSLPTHARRGVSTEEYYENLRKVADARPQVAIDDGGDITTLVHAQPRLLKELRGICEETTTGVVRARAMHSAGKLRVPVIDINGAQMKHLFDNRYGTGQSALEGLMRATNLAMAGKAFLVVGYGWVGKGIALRARGLGARVLVAEVDPVRAVEAHFDGFEVAPLKTLLPKADIVLTATGNADVVAGDAIDLLKDGAILANAGHFNVELGLKDLEARASRVQPKRVHLTEYSLRGNRRVLVVSEGRLVNLAAGEGHPVEVMDASFALQALCADHLAAQGDHLGRGVHGVPAAIDDHVARLALKAYGLGIDRLTARQRAYMASFEEGT